MMTRLPLTDRGITGGSDPQMARRWLTAIHQVLRGWPGEAELVGDMSSPTTARYYYTAQVRLSGRGILWLLLNTGEGVVAACPGAHGPPYGRSEFVDVPHSDVFAEYGFLVAEPAELSRDLDERIRSEPELAAVVEPHRRDIDYHGATSVGDLLFNWFD